MGAVYEVADTVSSNLRLALKEMSLTVVNDLPEAQRQDVITSFRREFELLRDLDHPNLVQAFEYFEANDHQYFVMEFLDGQTLERIHEKIPANTFLETAQVLEWAEQLCDVLSYLHAQKPPIIYRDLKPSNVIEGVDSHAIKIFDFGIARFFKAGKKGDTVAFGTLGYLAPEVVGHLTQTNEKTDVYALGVVLHQFLTNYDPMTDPYSFPAIGSINPTVPKNVARAIEHALESNPDKRTPTITAMLKELRGPKAVPSWRSSPAGSGPNVLPADPSLSPPPGKRAARPILAPGGLIPPALPANSMSLSVSPASIYLGSVPSGKTAQGTFHLKVPLNVSGQAVPSVPWLITRPESFSQGEYNVTITARTGKLACAPWRPAGQKWLVRLPAWLQKWVNFHACHIIRGHKSHSGSISIKTAGGMPLEVSVSVDVFPPVWRVRLGWVFVIILLLSEIALTIGALFLLAESL